jgi:hypothetical protein
MKHLKTLGLAILALVAVSALSGVASASAAEFHATEKGVAISGEQATSHKFTITGSSVTCTTAKFTGTTEATASTTQKVHPAYEGCTAFGFAGAIVNTTGCQYNFHTQTGTVDLESCTNGGITIEVNAGLGKCVTKVQNQTGINGQSWATGGSSPSRDITATSSANNIAAETTTSTGLCPLTVGKDTGGTYTGTTTMKAASGEIWYA